MPEPLKKFGIPLSTFILVVFAFGVAWTKHNEGMARVDQVERRYANLEETVRKNTDLLMRIDERTSALTKSLERLRP